MSNRTQWIVATAQVVIVAACMVAVVVVYASSAEHKRVDADRHASTDKRIAELSANVDEIRRWVNEGDRFTQEDGAAMNTRLLSLKSAIFEHISRLESESAENLRILSEIRDDMKTLLKGNP